MKSFRDGVDHEFSEVIDWLIDRVHAAAERRSISPWHEGYEAATRDLLRSLRLKQHHVAWRRR